MVRAKSKPQGTMTNKPFYPPTRPAFVLNFKLIYREQPFYACNRSINDDYDDNGKQIWFLFPTRV